MGDSELKKVLSIIKDTNKIVVLCSSLYQFLIFCALNKVNENTKRVFYIFVVGQKDYILMKTFKEIIERMKISKDAYAIYIKKRSEILTGIGNYKVLMVNRKIYNYFGNRIADVLFINFNWYKDYIHFPACRFQEEFNQCIMLEDSPFGYVNHGDSSLTKFIKRLYGLNDSFYKDSKIKGICVQNPEKYDKKFIEYLSKLDIDVLFGCLSSDGKDEILKIFLNKHELYEMKNIHNQSVGIVFTQCLSEEGYCTEKEKIRYFQEICDFYKQYGTVVLKRHPRDRTDYGELCIPVFSGEFPSELFNLCGIKFAFAVGICTGAINSIKADIKINLNENFYIEKTFNLKEIDIL